MEIWPAGTKQTECLCGFVHDGKMARYRSGRNEPFFSSLLEVSSFMRFRFLLLILAVSVALHAQNAAVTINVNATANRHPIDPNIYGVAFASTADLNDLNVPLNRSGGNA